MYVEQALLSLPYASVKVTDHEAERRSVARRNRRQFAAITLGTAALFVAAGALLGNETDASVDAEAAQPDSRQPGIELVYDNGQSSTQQESSALMLAVPGLMMGVGIGLARRLSQEDY